MACGCGSRDLEILTWAGIWMSPFVRHGAREMVIFQEGLGPLEKQPDELEALF